MVTCDIDCTLADLRKSYFEVACKQYQYLGFDGAALMEEYDYIQNVPAFSVQPDFGEFVSNLLRDSETYRNVLPLPGALEGLQEIVNVHPLKGYVSTRPERVLEISREWLARWKFPDAAAYHLPPEVAFTDADQWKAEQIIALHSLIHIDDRMETARCLLERGYQGTIFLLRGKSEISDGRVVCCDDLKEISQRIFKSVKNDR